MDSGVGTAKFRPLPLIRRRGLHLGPILPFLATLLAVALFTKESFFFHLLYALVGIYVLGRLWARRSVSGVEVLRQHEQRAFLGETLPATLFVANRGWLPVLWLRIRDVLPVELAAGISPEQVVSLLPHERLELHYTLFGRRRGLYRFGPVINQGGDLLGGIVYETQQAMGDFLIVYPRIVPLPNLLLPTRSPFGTLPSQQRIFEDPSRVLGVREYQPGDSLRHVNWKTSARLGTLQMRRYEPAIALATALFLNLDAGDFSVEHRFQAPEVAIVVAASMAAHLIELRQVVALITNGFDPLCAEEASPSVKAQAAEPAVFPLRRGREHLMHLLDLLARVDVAPTGQAVPFLELLGRKSLGLPWGSTVVAITPREVEGLMEVILTLRRRGLEVLLVLTCPDRETAVTARRAAHLGAQVAQVCSEQDLDQWR